MVSVQERPLYLANRPHTTGEWLEVRDKGLRGGTFARVARATAETVEVALAAAERAAPEFARMPAYARAEVLHHCVRRFEERREELARTLCIEAAKPIRDARGEVTRLIDTFRVAAEEATRITGEVLPMEISARARGYRGFWKRVPKGPATFITPFNFPLNLVAHKVAPALAAGCPFILKPASLTPVGALIIGEILAETELPEGAFSILPCSHDVALPLVEDPRSRHLSFTGSPAVGWELKARAVRKSVTLELGGNAAVVVDADVGADDALLDDAVQRILFGAYYQSGQSCVSVQRIYGHRSIYERLRERLVEGVRGLVAGDPLDERTFVGPLITEAEARRVESWVAEAVEGGARVLVGGPRQGALLPAHLLEGVPPGARLYRREVFGPVALLEPFDDWEAVVRAVNDSDYGLQAGIFTRDLYRALDAWDRLEVGGVIVGDVPSWRVDHMPYGGTKGSGLGREGIRFAIEELTELRLLAVREPPVGG